MPGYVTLFDSWYTESVYLPTPYLAFLVGLHFPPGSMLADSMN